MKRSWTVGFLAALLCVSTAATEAAVILPTASLQVGAQTFQLTPIADPTKAGRFFIDEFFSDPLFEVVVTATIDADPSILFGLTVTNFGTAPLAVGLSSTVAFAPLLSASARSGITGTLNDTGLDGLTLAPSQGGRVLISSDGGTSFGVNVGNALSFLGGPTPYGPFTSGASLIPGVSSLTIDVGFTLTGGGDVADLTGGTIVAVPEPTILSFMAFGAWGAARAIARRRPRHETRR